MLTGYALANTKRSWYVPDVSIWGTKGFGEFEILTIENVEAVKSLFFDSASIGDNSQSLAYNDLYDFRGNRLPVSIKNPKVFVKPRSADTVFVVGRESEKKFKIVRSASTPAPALVDLYIVEMGE